MDKRVKYVLLMLMFAATAGAIYILRRRIATSPPAPPPTPQGSQGQTAGNLKSLPPVRWPLQQGSRSLETAYYQAYLNQSMQHTGANRQLLVIDGIFGDITRSAALQYSPFAPGYKLDKWQYDIIITPIKQPLKTYAYNTQKVIL